MYAFYGRTDDDGLDVTCINTIGLPIKLIDLNQLRVQTCSHQDMFYKVNVICSDASVCILVDFNSMLGRPRHWDYWWDFAFMQAFEKFVQGRVNHYWRYARDACDVRDVRPRSCEAAER